jgi:hypothetical protein
LRAIAVSIVDITQESGCLDIEHLRQIERTMSR